MLWQCAVSSYAVALARVVLYVCCSVPTTAEAQHVSGVSLLCCETVPVSLVLCLGVSLGF
jgi:hypothetical protein